MKLLLGIVSVLAVSTIVCRGQLRHEAPDEPHQVKEAPSVIADGPQEHQGPNLEEHQRGIQQRKPMLSCPKFGGRCIPGKKACPVHLPLDTPPGAPFCPPKKRCCYQDECFSLWPPGFWVPAAFGSPNCTDYGLIPTGIVRPGGQCCQSSPVAPATEAPIPSKGPPTPADKCASLSPPGFWIPAGIQHPPTCNDYGAFPTGIFRLGGQCCQGSIDPCPNPNFTYKHVCTTCGNCWNVNSIKAFIDVPGRKPRLDYHYKPPRYSKSTVFCGQDDRGNAIQYIADYRYRNPEEGVNEPTCLIVNPVVTYTCYPKEDGTWKYCKRVPVNEGGPLCTGRSAIINGHYFRLTRKCYYIN